MLRQITTFWWQSLGCIPLKSTWTIAFSEKVVWVSHRQKKLVHTLQSWVIRLSFILSDLDAKTLQHASFGLVPFCPDYVLRKAGMIWDRT